jgi:hypothetical protein
MKSRVLSEFLAESKGRHIFISIKQDERGKYGCEGILEDYDDYYICLKSAKSIYIIAIDIILNFQIDSDKCSVEVVV